MRFFRTRKEEKKRVKDGSKKKVPVKHSAEELFKASLDLYQKACKEIDGFSDKPFDQGFIITLQNAIKYYNGSLTSSEWLDLSNYIDEFSDKQTYDDVKKHLSNISRYVLTEYIESSKREREYAEKREKAALEETKTEFQKEISSEKKSKVATEKLIALTSQQLIDNLFADISFNDNFGDNFVDTLKSIAAEQGVNQDDLDWQYVRSYAFDHSHTSRNVLQVRSRWIDVAAKSSIADLEQQNRKMQNSLNQLSDALLGYGESDVIKQQRARAYKAYQEAYGYNDSSTSSSTVSSSSDELDDMFSEHSFDDNSENAKKY